MVFSAIIALTACSLSETSEDSLSTTETLDGSLELMSDNYSEEEQIPGQQEIADYPEILPENTEAAEKSEETPEEIEAVVEEKRQTRKEYLDDCTAYGFALYMKRFFLYEECAKEIVMNTDRMEAWLKEKVDKDGNAI